MLKFALAILAAAFAIPAAAADLPARSPAPAPYYAVAPSFTWAGLYAGGVVGYGWTKHTAESATINGRPFNLAGFPDRSIEADGFSAGATVGYNLQFGRIVAGVEADLSWANLEGSRLVGPVAVNVKTDWYGTARARVGYSFDRFLPYVTGGAIYTHSKLSAAGFGGSVAADSGNFGWVVGAGLEYAFADRWSAKVEYLHGRVDQDFGATVGRVSGSIAGEQRLDLVRVGVNYGF